jgi:aerobic-type carbon monoxide dehydrogenase small subunit (CoxS/CutS family)
MAARHITLYVNGERLEALVDPRRTLADALREDVDLPGTKLGCEHGICGACTVLVNGAAVRACLMLAVQAEHAHIETVEGLTDTGELSNLQDAFRRHHALQCGFCTPGMLMSMTEYLRDTESATDEEIREALGGNICRCTGYQGIVEAVKDVMESRRGDSDR